MVRLVLINIFAYLIMLLFVCNLLIGEVVWIIQIVIITLI